jgi:hypothetical protein
MGKIMHTQPRNLSPSALAVERVVDVAWFEEPFADQRNTLSHIADKPGKPRFIEVKELARDWDQIRLTVSGVTYLLCAEVAGELTESAARAVRPETWDELKWEVMVYD